MRWTLRSTAPEQSDIVLVGGTRQPLRDVYHAFLRARWSLSLGAIVLAFIVANLVFGSIYFLTGGIAQARPDSFADAFYFSVQTMATIGYGVMHPVTPLAHALVLAEAVVGLLFTALSTGLVFSKFAQTTSRMVFGRHVALGPMHGVPTLAFRIGNERGSAIVEAAIHVSLVRTEHVPEGGTFYRMLDLSLVRHRVPALSRSWSVLHSMHGASPLTAATPESCARDEVELHVSVSGTDEVTMQPVIARHRYLAKDFVWGARLADVISERSDGRLELDLRLFHDLAPTEPTESFPYHWDGAPGDAPQVAPQAPVR